MPGPSAVHNFSYNQSLTNTCAKFLQDSRSNFDSQQFHNFKHVKDNLDYIRTNCEGRTVCNMQEKNIIDSNEQDTGQYAYP